MKQMTLARAVVRFKLDTSMQSDIIAATSRIAEPKLVAY